MGIEPYAGQLSEAHRPRRDGRNLAGSYRFKLPISKDVILGQTFNAGPYADLATSFDRQEDRCPWPAGPLHLTFVHNRNKY